MNDAIEQGVADAREQQANAVAEAEARDAMTPTPSQEEVDRAKLGMSLPQFDGGKTVEAERARDAEKIASLEAEIVALKAAAQPAAAPEPAKAAEAEKPEATYKNRQAKAN